MFIETVLNTTRAPAERNVSGNCLNVHFAPLECEGSFGGRAFYEHFGLRDQDNCLENLVKKARS
jgi:hypothetical protein